MEKWQRYLCKKTAEGIDQVQRSSSSIHNNPGSAVSSTLTGNQLRQDLRRWLSPPDPSTNHNIACGAHHEGTATWIFQENIFKEWRSTGSLLWIHGKRMSSTLFNLAAP